MNDKKGLFKTLGFGAGIIASIAIPTGLFSIAFNDDSWMTVSYLGVGLMVIAIILTIISAQIKPSE